MSLLVAIPRHQRTQNKVSSYEIWGCRRGVALKLEVALDEFAEFLAVFVAHVDEFHAAAIRTDIADDGGEIDLAKTGADLELDRVANAELSGRLDQARGP